MSVKFNTRSANAFSGLKNSTTNDPLSRNYGTNADSFPLADIGAVVL